MATGRSLASPALPRGIMSGAGETYLCFAIAAALLLSYGEIFRGVVHSPLRSNSGEDAYAFVFNYARYLVCAGTIVVSVLSGPGAFSRPLRLMVPLLPYGAAAAITILWTADLEVTVRYTVLLVGFLFVAGFLIDRLGAPKLLGVILHFLAFVVVVSTLVAIVLPALGRHDPSDLAELNHVGRWRGIFSHKNALGAYAALASILLFTHSHLMRAPRPYLWFARACAWLCLAMSGSSTAVFGVVALAGTYALFHRRQVAHPVVLVMAFIVALLAFNLSSSDMVAEALGRDATFSGRTLIWGAALDIWAESPWGGYGYAAGTLAVLGPFLTHSLFPSAVDAHNAYLDIMIDTGLLGLGAFLFGVGTALSRGYHLILRGSGSERAAAIAMMMILVSGLAMAAGEVSPLRLVGNGGYLVFAAILALADRKPMSVQRLHGPPDGGAPYDAERERSLRGYRRKPQERKALKGLGGQLHRG